MAEEASARVGPSDGLACRKHHHPALGGYREVSSERIIDRSAGRRKDSQPDFLCGWRHGGIFHPGEDHRRRNRDHRNGPGDDGTAFRGCRAPPPPPVASSPPPAGSPWCAAAIVPEYCPVARTAEILLTLFREDSRLNLRSSFATSATDW